ncbi:aromatic acid exporter family protein [Streptomyces sp. NPDC008121]|uniref:FUSC family protein n=1 Tax=Streptomyces sp. NPDC008121 TaxID=3364809 RepID=UPI0036E62902
MRDAVRGPGEARDRLLLLAKGAAAATAAWCLASWLLPVNVTAFAPFTALLALQSTVYRSLWDSVQYLGAMAIGTAVAAGFGSTVGVHAWTLAVLVFIALLVARLDLLGGQRGQVPVVALFAFVGGGGRLDYIGPLVTSAAIGVCCGLAAHFAIAPSPHTDTARRRVADLAAHTADLLRDLARTAAGETEDEDVRQDWPHRCEELVARAAHARTALEKEQENTRLNPRRPWNSAQASLLRCHEAVSMIERIGTYVRSIARALAYERQTSAPAGRERPAGSSPDSPGIPTGTADEAADASGEPPGDASAATASPEASAAADFLASYAGLLHATAEALVCLDPPRGPEDSARLRRLVEDAERRYEDTTALARTGHLDHPGEWPVHGTALVEAARVLEEITYLSGRGEGARE